MAAAAEETKAQYSAIVLGATGNVGGRIVQILIKNPLCKKVVVVTRRKTDAFADPKVSEIVVNMDRLEEEVAPHARGVDVALAAFGVGKGSAKMPEEEVRKIEIAYPQAFCRAAKAGGARVCGVMTAANASSRCPATCSVSRSRRPHRRVAAVGSVRLKSNTQLLHGEDAPLDLMLWLWRSSEWMRRPRKAPCSATG
jgi:hypothetical protein